jgi:hypothetical protein
MLSNSNGLLDEVVKILWDLRSQTCKIMFRKREKLIMITVSLQNSYDLVSSDILDLSDTVRVSENDSNLRRS